MEEQNKSNLRVGKCRAGLGNHGYHGVRSSRSWRWKGCLELLPRRDFFSFQDPAVERLGQLNGGLGNHRKNLKQRKGQWGCEQRPLSRLKAQEAIF